jgi:hypothetical protein
VLTSIRVGNKQKKIDIAIPKLDAFIHKVYIHVARKAYSNVYLFEKNILPLAMQKNMRELELIVQECILTAIRESIPTEEIIRSYMDESVEQEEEVTVETIEEPVKPTEENISQNGGDLPEVPINESAIKSDEDAPYITPTIKDINDEPVITRLTSNNIEDYTGGTNNSYSQIDEPVSAPSKTLERLEQMTTANAFKRKLDEIEESGDISSDKIKIFTDPIDLSGFEELDEKKGKVTDDFLLEDVEELF